MERSVVGAIENDARQQQLPPFSHNWLLHVDLVEARLKPDTTGERSVRL
jgi:hypothetical protein